MKIVKIFSVILAISLVFTACSNNQSLSDLTIVEAVGIDLENGEIVVSLQYLNLDKSGATADSLTDKITSVVYGKSSTVSKAISSTFNEMSNKLFFGQNKVIVFGKDYVEKQIDSDFDYLLRSVDSNPEVLVAVCDSDAKSVIESKENDAKIPAESLFKLLNSNEKVNCPVTVNDLLKMYCSKTGDIYLPIISAGKDYCYLNGIAIFSNNKYVKSLNLNQSLGFLALKNKLDGGYLNIHDDDLGEIDLEIEKIKTKSSISYDNNQYIFDCNINASLTLDEVENGISTAIDEKKIKAIESLANKRLEELCTYAFNTCIDSKSDALMIAKYLARDCPKQYDLVKDNWRQNLDKIKLQIKVKSNLEKVNDTALRR